MMNQTLQLGLLPGNFHCIVLPQEWLHELYVHLLLILHLWKKWVGSHDTIMQPQKTTTCFELLLLAVHLLSVSATRMTRVLTLDNALHLSISKSKVVQCIKQLVCNYLAAERFIYTLYANSRTYPKYDV